MLQHLPGAARPPTPALGPAPTWSRAAIHDTLATIVQQPGYTRSLKATLLERLMHWLGDLLRNISRALGDVPHGRRIATIAAAVLLMLVVARLLLATRLRTESAGRAGRAVGRRASGTEIWREAESLAAMGQFTDAAHALYRATLSLLAGHGVVRWHESKTSGDYARELRQRGSPLYAAFRRFGVRYDRIIYGTGSCDAAAYAALRDDARPLVEWTPGARAA